MLEETNKEEAHGTNEFTRRIFENNIYNSKK